MFSLYPPQKKTENQKQPQRALHQKFCPYLLSANIFLKVTTKIQIRIFTKIFQWSLYYW